VTRFPLPQPSVRVSLLRKAGLPNCRQVAQLVLTASAEPLSGSSSPLGSFRAGDSRPACRISGYKRPMGPIGAVLGGRFAGAWGADATNWAWPLTRPAENPNGHGVLCVCVSIEDRCRQPIGAVQTALGQMLEGVSPRRSYGQLLSRRPWLLFLLVHACHRCKTIGGVSTFNQLDPTCSASWLTRTCGRREEWDLRLHESNLGED
jgi:hypothetical protein